MCEDGSAQNVNLENWMRDLPEQLKNVPFIYLAIPGNVTICLMLYICSLLKLCVNFIECKKLTLILLNF